MPAPHSNVRLLEDPLGPDAVAIDSRAQLTELLAVFADACRAPPPAYSVLALRRAFPGPGCGAPR